MPRDLALSVCSKSSSRRCARRRQILASDIFDELVQFGVLRIDVGALIDAGEERVGPVFGVLDRISAGAHGDEAGEVLVFRAQAVGDPGAHAGAGDLLIAAVHEHQRRLMIGDFGPHRSNDAQVVGTLAEPGKQVADLDSAFAVALVFPRRRKRPAGLSFGWQIAAGHRLAGVLFKHGFGVESIDLRGSSIEENMHDAFGLGSEVREARRQRIGNFRGAGPRGGKQSRFAQERW